MAERAPDRLLVVGLATFHTTLLLAVLVGAGYATATIGDLLGGLGTLTGFALFGLLWGTTLWTNWRWLASVGLLADERDARNILRRATVWGGIDGVLFFLGFLVIFLLVRTAPGTTVTIEGVGLVGFFALLGSAVATVVGGVLGVLLGALDLGLIRVAASFVPDERAPGKRL